MISAIRIFALLVTSYSLIAQVSPIDLEGMATKLNVVSCSDGTGRNVEITKFSKDNENWGHLVQVKSSSGQIVISRIIISSQRDVTFPKLFETVGIKITIPTIQLSDIPHTQVRGAMKLRGENQVDLLCSKGPGF